VIAPPPPVVLSVKSTKRSSKFHFNQFRIEPLTVFNSSSSNTYSVMLSWRPDFQLSEKFRVGIALGSSLYKESEGGQFLAYEYVLSGNYEISKRWSTELFAGFQTWIVNNNDSGAIVGVNAKYSLNKKHFKYFDHVTVGYSTLSQDKAYNMIRVGLGVSL